MEFELNSLSSANGNFQLGIISLVNDSKMEGVFGDSFSERGSYGDSLEALPSRKQYGGEDHIERPMPPHILTEREIEAAQQRRQHVGYIVQLYQGMTGDEPSDAEIASHLNDMGKSYGVSWVKPDDHFKAGELT